MSQKPCSHPWSIPLRTSLSTSIKSIKECIGLYFWGTCGFHFYLSIFIPSEHDPLLKLQWVQLSWPFLLLHSLHSQQNNLLKIQKWICFSLLMKKIFMALEAKSKIISMNYKVPGIGHCQIGFNSGHWLSFSHFSHKLAFPQILQATVLPLLP